jgi:hypothetical protein
MVPYVLTDDALGLPTALHRVAFTLDNPLADEVVGDTWAVRYDFPMAAGRRIKHWEVDLAITLVTAILSGRRRGVTNGNVQQCIHDALQIRPA